MYIKEDLIIPHHYSFHDFIINKARGKSGPLFSFDVHEDVRMTSNAKVEKDEVICRTLVAPRKTILPSLYSTFFISILIV